MAIAIEKSRILKISQNLPKDAQASLLWMLLSYGGAKIIFAEVTGDTVRMEMDDDDFDDDDDDDDDDEEEEDDDDGDDMRCEI